MFEIIRSILDSRPLFSQYVYPTLPQKCICPRCGYMIYNPGAHCREIRCPKCGTYMRRGI